jgi:RND family efflux transporter MFP subunit
MDPARTARFRLVELLLGISLAGVIAASGCGRHEAPQATAPKTQELPVISAEVLEIQPVDWPRTVRSQGTLVADEVVVVGAKIAGRVEEITVDLGDVVPANASIATLDQAEFKLQIALAEAQLVQARSALGLRTEDPLEKLNPINAPPVREARAVLDEAKTRTERLQPLRARNAVTQEELDAALAAEAVAEARYTSAYNGVLEKIAQIRVRSAELQLAQQRLVDAVVLAPFEGTVHQRHVARGSYVQIGDPLVTLVRTSVLRFQGTLPERHAVRIALGQEVRLSIESLAEPRSATITRISPVITEQSRSLMFEAELDNRDGALQTGLFAEAEVVIDRQSQVVAVPPDAITEFAGAEKVWKVVDGVAQEQIVETARREDAAVEIIGGLNPGDIILTNGAAGQVARIEPVTGTSVAKPVSLAVDPDQSESADPQPAESPPESEEVTSGAAAE